MLPYFVRVSVSLSFVFSFFLFHNIITTINVRFIVVIVKVYILKSETLYRVQPHENMAPRYALLLSLQFPVISSVAQIQSRRCKMILT